MYIEFLASEKSSDGAYGEMFMSGGPLVHRICHDFSRTLSEDVVTMLISVYCVPNKALEIRTDASASENSLPPNSGPSGPTVQVESTIVSPAIHCESSDHSSVTGMASRGLITLNLLN